MAREYVAFISYRHRPLDMRIAVRTHRLIEQFRVPGSLHASRKRLGLVFRDQDELPVTSDLSADIYEALDHSEFLIVICTPDTPRSQWVCREIDYFLEHHDRRRVLTVLAEGEPQEAMPPALTRVVDENGEWVRDVEPLSADVRAESGRAAERKLKREINRIFAAMLGCPYDALVMRQQRRQRRRLAAGFSLALAVAIGFSAVQLWNNARIREVNDQLEIRNRELSEEKAATQLRESRLLTINSRDALAAGDAQAAIRSAIEALPSDAQGDRPYYAPAEQALISALGVFDPNSPQYMITGTRLEQSTAIVDFAPSADGARVTTIDSYGVLHCFDSETGELAWEAQIADSNAYVSEASIRLFPISEGNFVVAAYDDALVAVSVESGRELWREPRAGSDIGFIFLSPDERTVACLRMDLERAAICFFSTADGAQRWEVELAGGEKLEAFRAGLSYKTARNGCFSQDGGTFFGTYDEAISDGQAIEAEGKFLRNYYAVDLESGRLRILYSEEIDTDARYAPFLGMAHSAAQRSVVALYEDSFAPTGTIVRQIDQDTGALLWEGEIPKPEEIPYFDGTPEIHMVMGDSFLTYSRDEALFFLDLRMHELFGSAVLPSEVRALERIGMGNLSCVLADGTHEAAFLTTGGDFCIESSVKLEACSAARLWNSGFFRSRADDERGIYTEIEFDRAQAGCAVLKPEAGGAALVVKRVKSLNDPRPQIPVEGAPAEIQPEQIDRARGAFPAEDGLLYLRVSEKGEGGEKVDSALGIDPKAHRVEKKIALNSDMGQNIDIFPDASGCVEEKINGELSKWDFASGERTVLDEADEVELMKSGDTLYVASDAVTSSARQTEGGALLTVRCDGEGLRIWRNGEGGERVNLPEGCVSRFAHGAFLDRMLAVGGNGYALISVYDSERPSEAMRGFGLYNLREGTWTQIDDVARGSDDRPLAMAGAAPRFAVLDADGALRVYDAEAGSLAREIPIGLPANSVDEMQFIGGDRYLLLKSSDRRLRIVEIEAGAVVYEEHFPDVFYEGVRAYFDEEGRRLYLVNQNSIGAGLGVCLDTRNWSELFRVERMLCYLPETNEIYAVRNRSGTFEDELYAQEMLRTPELIELGGGI